MKRARSVAIFSLKLKERRAREAQEKANKLAVTPTALLPPPHQGGELSCIPIEKVKFCVRFIHLTFKFEKLFNEEYKNFYGNFFIAHTAGRYMSCAKA